MKIAIIGGGIAGLMLAYKATLAGHHTELFEATTIASGASGKALGVLVPVTGLNRPIDILQRSGIAAWPALLSNLTSRTGTPLATLWRDHGNGRQQLNTGLIFQELAQAITLQGGIIHINSPVTAQNLPQGFDITIFAAGYGNKNLTGSPLTISAGLAAQFHGQVEGLTAEDNLFICNDFSENTVLAGSVNWPLSSPADGSIPPEKLDELINRVKALEPHLTLKKAWVGYRPVQAPRLPLIKQMSPTTYAVTGLGKIGLGLSPMLELPT